MAGFSIILLMMLFLWPVALLVFLAGLAFMVIEAIVTSAAFPAIIFCALTGFLGFVEAVLTLWRWHKDPKNNPLSVRAFTKTFVLYAISFVALCVALYFGGVALVDLYHSMGETTT